MALLALTSLALQVGAQIAQSVGTRRMARQQRAFARQAEQDILARGEEEAAVYQRKVQQLQGRQTAAAGAQGLDITQGSVAAIQRETATMAQQDLATIRENARREAWGVRTQANLNYRAAQNVALAQQLGAVGTLLGGPEGGWSSVMNRPRTRP